MQKRPLASIRFMLSIITMIALVFMVVIFAMSAGIYPPPNADALMALGGSANLLKYGVRLQQLAIFILGCCVIGLLFILGRFPRLYKYPVEITPRNVGMQYDLAKVMLILNMLVVAVYVCLLLLGLQREELALPSPRFLQVSVVCAVAAGVVTGGYFAVAHRHA